MSTPDASETIGQIDPTAQHDLRYVDWGAIVAGTVIASAITLVLSGFGTALGLSLTSVSGSGLSGIGMSIAGGLWVLWVAISSLVAGAYVTGRLRRRAGDANAQEVMVRDGAHGLVVWGLSALVGAILAASVFSGLARTGAELTRSASMTIGAVIGSSSEAAIDALMRSENVGAVDEPTRQQIGRIVVRSFADGQLAVDDRAYLSRTIAARTGVAPEEVERRIEAAITRAKASAVQAKEAAERARRIGILVAFLAAASMALGAAAAWWGASMGGRHRDENTDLSTYMRW